MKFDFDRIIERRGTGSVKYDAMARRGWPEDTIAMWIADMDFQVAPCIVEALRETADFGIFGYGDAKPSYFEAVKGWMQKRFGWQVEEDWLVRTPGVVMAFYNAIRSLTEPGDAVLIMPPVYYPFKSAILRNGRTLSEAPLRDEGGVWSLDFDLIEQKLQNDPVKVCLFSNPHNPVGRVWTKDELTRLGRLLKKYNVTMISDEIHMDFICPGYTHTVFQTIEDFADFTVTCTSPSKSFNLAGLQNSNIFIKNPALREKFQNGLNDLSIDPPNIFGTAAGEAAYRGGEEWFDECWAYIRGNFDYFRAYVKEHLPKLKIGPHEACYLLWVDFRPLGLPNEKLEELMTKEAKLWLDPGTMFGTGGEGYERFNLACPRSVVEECLQRLEKVFGPYAK